MEQVRREVFEKWHAPRALPTEFMLEQALHEDSGVSEATHVAKVARIAYKNLAHQFTGEWRGDGTLANLHRQKWWWESDPALPPLASDTAGMAAWDPGKMDEIDDSIPTIKCKVAEHIQVFMDGHVAVCPVCKEHERRHGRVMTPGQMCPGCPDNIGLVAHRMRTGYVPHFTKEPLPVQDTNRNSCGKFWTGTCKAMEKFKSVDGHIVDDDDGWTEPEFTVALGAAVQEKHLRAAEAAGWPHGPELEPAGFGVDRVGDRHLRCGDAAPRLADAVARARYRAGDRVCG